MATAGSLITNIQVLFGDTNGDFITDARGLDWLSRAQRRFCQNVQPIDEIKDYTITAKEELQDLPTDCLLPIWAIWYQSRVTKLEYTPPDLWGRLKELHPNTTGTPERYTILARQLEVGPQVPTTTSATSTASGDFATGDTTFNLTAATLFRSKGFVKVGNEVIKYTALATTTLTGCTRGVHNTTATTHSSNTAVTEVDLQMLYRRSPTNLTATTAEVAVPDVYQDYLEKYVLYLAWLARGDTEKAQIIYNEFIELEQDAIKTTSRRSRDGLIKIRESWKRWQWW